MVATCFNQPIDNIAPYTSMNLIALRSEVGGLDVQEEVVMISQLMKKKARSKACYLSLFSILDSFLINQILKLISSLLDSFLLTHFE